MKPTKKLPDKIPMHDGLDVAVNRAIYTAAFTYGMLAECFTKLRREYVAIRERNKSTLQIRPEQVDLVLDAVQEGIGRIHVEQKVAVKMTLARRGFLK